VTILGSIISNSDKRWPYQDAWVDQTQPDAQVALFGFNSEICANKKAGALPDPTLLRKALEQIRGVRIAPAAEQPAEATDLKIFRVILNAGPGKDCLRLQAGKSAGNRVQTK
jgi:hypothetical protein